MTFTHQHDETALMLPGPAGDLEARWATPPGTDPHRSWALVCHPHPLHGGTMHNKVVTTLCRAFHREGIATLRFNYRGVGDSQGSYGDIEGECADAEALYTNRLTLFPEATRWCAGFSFGSFVAAYLGSQHPDLRGVISVAPPTERMPFEPLKVTCPWWVLHGDADEVASFEHAEAWATQHPTLHWHPYSQVGHFFHGHLILLQEDVQNMIRNSSPCGGE